MTHTLYSGPAVPQAAVEVRRALETLPRPDALPPGMLADLQLAATELITNAIRAGSPTITVVIAVPPPVLQLAVSDDADGLPIIGDPSGDATHGRGLNILAAVAERWGVDRHPGDGKTIWATFS